MGVMPKPTFPTILATLNLLLLGVGAYTLYHLGTKVSSLENRAPVQFNLATSSAPVSQAASFSPVQASDHRIGSSSPTLTIVEYSDTECPFCKQFHPTLQKLLAANPSYQLVYRYFPLPIHQNAEKEAEALECLSQQKGDPAFWPFLNSIFTQTTSTSPPFPPDQLPPPP